VDKIHLEVVTLESVVFSGMVESFDAPTRIGRIGVLPGHAPIVTALVPGVLSLRREDREEMLVVDAGFLEMRRNEAKILVNSSEPVEGIDVERALAARERALRRLATPHEDVDTARAEASLARSNARLKSQGLT
jgi:F-type H+-transporting ATPase subunit epsilon